MAHSSSFVQMPTDKPFLPRQHRSADHFRGKKTAPLLSAYPWLRRACAERAAAATAAASRAACGACGLPDSCASCRGENSGAVRHFGEHFAGRLRAACVPRRRNGVLDAEHGVQAAAVRRWR
jgi:hypothetical protein